MSSRAPDFHAAQAMDETERVAALVAHARAAMGRFRDADQARVDEVEGEEAPGSGEAVDEREERAAGEVGREADTDDEREVAYDRESSFGRLDHGLDEAGERGWVVIDMAEDWDRVFPFTD